MSRFGIDAIDSKKKHAKHLRAVSEKFDVLRKKQLLLDIWEEIDAKECDPSVHTYVLGLRARVRSIRNQYNNMRPITDDVNPVFGSL